MKEIIERLGKEKYDELFGDGKNKVTLALLKSKEFLGEENFNFLVNTIEPVIYFLFFNIKSIINDRCSDYNIIIEEIKLKSENYELDNGGICEDGDIHCIRYKNLKDGKIYKMKVSKFFHKVAEESLQGLAQEVIHWLGEVIADKWTSERIADQRNGGYTLHTGNKREDFMKIYKESPSNTIHSCMSNGFHIDFYLESVDATAAWLEDGSGVVVARCVIYNKVFDTTGKVYRLAERQYSNKEVLNHVLIKKLIEADLIDGYKQIGAGAGESKLFLDKTGKLLLNTNLLISCLLYPGSILSYQDSFKYYNDFRKEAYNFDPNYSLDNTDTEVCITDGFIKCPNCGKYFAHNGFSKDGLRYCSKECRDEAKNTFLDNGIQKVKNYKYLKYDPEKRTRIWISTYVCNPELVCYEGTYYSGYITEFEDGEKIPTEYIIQQVDLKGNVVKEYQNLTEIKKQNPEWKTSLIMDCIHGEYRTYYKYVWRRKGF